MARAAENCKRGRVLLRTQAGRRPAWEAQPKDNNQKRSHTRTRFYSPWMRESCRIALWPPVCSMGKPHSVFTISLFTTYSVYLRLLNPTPERTGGVERIPKPVPARSPSNCRSDFRSCESAPLPCAAARQGARVPAFTLPGRLRHGLPQLGRPLFPYGTVTTKYTMRPTFKRQASQTLHHLIALSPPAPQRASLALIASAAHIGRHIQLGSVGECAVFCLTSCALLTS